MQSAFGVEHVFKADQPRDEKGRFTYARQHKNDSHLTYEKVREGGYTDDEYEMEAENAHIDMKSMFRSEGDPHAWSHNRNQLRYSAALAHAHGDHDMVENIETALDTSLPRHRKAIREQGIKEPKIKYDPYHIDAKDKPYAPDSDDEDEHVSKLSGYDYGTGKNHTVATRVGWVESDQPHMGAKLSQHLAEKRGGKLHVLQPSTWKKSNRQANATAAGKKALDSWKMKNGKYGEQVWEHKNVASGHKNYTASAGLSDRPFTGKYKTWAGSGSAVAKQWQ